MGLDVIYNIPLLPEWLVELGSSFVGRPACVVQPCDIQDVAEIRYCFHARLILKKKTACSIEDYFAEICHLILRCVIPVVLVQ